MVCISMGQGLFFFLSALKVRAFRFQLIAALSDVYRKCPYKFLFKLNDSEKTVKRRGKQKLQFPMFLKTVYCICSNILNEL